ncbi:globin-1-like [Gigantopelta aegis]|uniref:globin-1-like n=1 Tax=Gigantopelta aegis TaxID=1735272 RepID=UPI001B88D906|nr:globin-1-like [Gigantopelta aegis]
MGCTTSNSSRPESTIKNTCNEKKPADSCLSLEQKHLVKKTWRYLSQNILGRGTKTFLRIFEVSPHVKALFPNLVDKEGEHLSNDTSFQGHATRFMQIVGAVVDNIDNLDDAVCPILIGLGRQHIHFSDFKPSYFDAFKDGMAYTWKDDLGEKYNGNTEEAWDIVFDFIMDKLKEGYNLAVAEQKLIS